MSGGRARPTRVTPGPGLGQAIPADDLAAGHRHEEPLLLLGRAGEVERAATQARVGRHDEPERAPDPPDLLDGDGVGQGIEPGTTLVLRDRDAEPAHLADVPDDLDGEPTLALVGIDDGGDLVEHVRADRVAQEPMLARQIQVHGREPTTATARRGDRC